MKRNRAIYTFFFTLLVLFAALLSGCNASMPAPTASMSLPAQEHAGMDEAYDMAEAEAGELPAGAPMDRKIIGTANIDLVVSDTESTIDTIAQLVQTTGGYVADTNFYDRAVGDQSMLAGSMTLRVPAAELDRTLEDLAALAVDVMSQSLTREDVTDQYTDLNARLRNLEATETELRALLGDMRAKPDAEAEDILAVYRDLTEIRGQIEQVQGRKNMLDNLISLATIHVSLSPDMAELPIVDARWRPGTTGSAALRALVGSLQNLGDMAIWVALYVLPIMALVLLPIIAVIWLAVRFLRRRSAQDRQHPAAHEVGA